jgi:hypothetical protein
VYIHYDFILWRWLTQCPPDTFVHDLIPMGAGRELITEASEAMRHSFE